MSKLGFLDRLEVIRRLVGCTLALTSCQQELDLAPELRQELEDQKNADRELLKADLAEISRKA